MSVLQTPTIPADEAEVLDMVDGVDHIKMVTPDPEAVNHFLSSIAGFSSRPVETLGGQGPLGMFGVGAPPAEPVPLEADESGALPLEAVYTERGADGTGGFVCGSDETTRRFQVFRGENPHIWSVALNVKDIEGARAECIEAGYPVTDIHLVKVFGKEEHCRFFFALVGGVVFEIKRREALPETTDAG